MAAEHSFSLDERRLHKADYTKIFANNSLKVHQGCILLLAVVNKLGYPRLGTVVAKKSIASAVLRNRYKRVIREYVRLQCNNISLDLVVLVKRHTPLLSKCELDKLVDKAFRRLLTRYTDTKG